MLPQINCIEILWSASEVVSRTGAASGLEPEVLEGDEPREGQEVCNDNVRPHHLKHSFLTLQVEHKHGHKKQNQTTIGQKVKLLGHVFGAVQLDSIYGLAFGEALVAFVDNEIAKHGSRHQLEGIVNGRHLVRYVPIDLSN